MTHDDYIWIAIRVLGLYMLVQALTAVVGAISGGYALLFILEGSAVRDRAALHLVEDAVAVVVYGWLGRYLVLDGHRVFSWSRQGQERFLTRRGTNRAA